MKTNKSGLEELKTYKRYKCIECHSKEFGLCKTSDCIFPDVICIKCGCIFQK